jgi:undecaprenyl diphosphate synthase
MKRIWSPETAVSRNGLLALSEEVLLKRIRARPVPRHVAIIMDGNGRWARARGLPRVAGHREGVRAARGVVRAAGEAGVEYLTLYAFSSENWTRPSSEVRFLMDLLESSIDRELPELCKHDVRLRVIGRDDNLPPAVRRGIARAERATNGNQGLTLVVALNYGARAELVDAFRELGRRLLGGDLQLKDIDEAAVFSALYTEGIPDPDLLIRTSGEMRISNFLLWQIAYTELWMTPTLWPDFRPREFYRAVLEFQGRERRFGGVKHRT